LVPQANNQTQDVMQGVQSARSCHVVDSWVQNVIATFNQRRQAAIDHGNRATPEMVSSGRGGIIAPNIGTR